MIGPRRIRLTALAAALAAVVLAVYPSPPAAIAAPEGQATWAVHVSLAPTWFDPAETSGIITPFMVLYALHDALVKPMPGQADGAVAWPSRGPRPRTASSTSSCCARACASTTATR